MEIHMGGKSYKIAWEFILAPFLIFLVAALLIQSNFSSIRHAYIDYTEGLATTVPIFSQANPDPGAMTQESALSTIGTAKPLEEALISSMPSKISKVNINKADMEELMTLPFIGEVKSQAILIYRTEHGPFKTIDELDNIKGIGPKTLEKLRPFVALE